MSRVVATPQGRRFFTFKLLAAGTVQAPESLAMSWLASVENFLGSLVAPLIGPGGVPDLGPTASRQQQEAVRRATGSDVGMVVSEVVAKGLRLTCRLVSATLLTPLFVDAEELSRWPHADRCVYLVRLCTTPPTMGHISPYRHDYRKGQQPHAKGDWVVMEGRAPGTQDLGVVIKVLTGDKGEKFAAASAAKGGGQDGHPSYMRRVLWKCSPLEYARRDKQLVSLEKTVLPLLSARLPAGAEALGVGASLDGSYLRLFVRLPDTSKAAASKAAAAAAALGALLGCETELLAGEAPPGHNGTAAAADMPPATGPPPTQEAAAGREPSKLEGAEKQKKAKAGKKEKTKKIKGKNAKDKQKAQKNKEHNVNKDAKKGTKETNKEDKKRKKPAKGKSVLKSLGACLNRPASSEASGSDTSTSCSSSSSSSSSDG